MTAAVKTNGIWCERASVRIPRDRWEIPSSKLDYIYYDLIASENAATRVGVFLDGSSTATDEYTISTHVFERMGKTVTRSLLYPEEAKTAGIHTVVIKTGTKTGSNPTEWKWTSPAFEVIIPTSGATPEE